MRGAGNIAIIAKTAIQIFILIVAEVSSRLTRFNSARARFSMSNDSTLSTAKLERLHQVILADDNLCADIKSWWEWRNQTPYVLTEAFAQLFSTLSEFRSVVHYRFKESGAERGLLPAGAQANDLYLRTPGIGPGLRVQHGHSTWVIAERIGANFHVNQNVTIGVNKGGKPTIGDNVRVCTGAVIFGAITIGDNVVIAPNAVVNFDVPSGKKVFPARSVIV